MSLVPCSLSQVSPNSRRGIALIARPLTLAGIVVAAVLSATSIAHPQDPQPNPQPGAEAAEPVDASGWPTYPLPPARQFGKDRNVGRGPGFYLNFFKLG